MNFIFKIIKKITPAKVRKLIRDQLRASLIPSEADTAPRQIRLQPVHVQCLRALVDRHELIEALPKGGIVAEIGVAEGNFSAEILKRAYPQKLHLVDAWHTSRYGLNMQTALQSRFQTEINSGKIQIHRGLSTDIGLTFADNYFDWIYIDTDHSYHTTKAELEIYRTKVKKNGIIAGHDLTKGNFDRWVRYGVIEAVFEFCLDHHWRILYQTMELHEYPSFAIQRIDY